MGVVVRRYIRTCRLPHITYPTPLVSVLFFSSISTFCSLTLGAHARGLQYLFCLCVCVSVCFPYSGTSRNQAYKQQYQRLQRDTGMKYKMGFFF